MIFHLVGKFDYDSAEVCCLCFGFITANEFYARGDSKIAHYKCAKRKHWKRETRKKLKNEKREILPRTITVLRDGIVVKRVPYKSEDNVSSSTS